MDTRAVHAAPRAIARWLDDTVLGLARELRWSYLPPLMVYVAAGVSGLTAIVGTFTVDPATSRRRAPCASRCGVNVFEPRGCDEDGTGTRGSRQPPA